MANKDSMMEGDRKALELFPFGHDENGVCEKLVDNKCTVYETRPLLCRVKSMHKKFYADKINQRDYFNFVGNICNTWIKDAGGTEFVKKH